MPAHADAEVPAEWAEHARAVRADLAAAGLPLAPQDVGPELAVGTASWRDGLGAQAARREETLAATAASGGQARYPADSHGQLHAAGELAPTTLPA
jgi:hypothetical protein